MTGERGPQELHRALESERAAALEELGVPRRPFFRGEEPMLDNYTATDFVNVILYPNVQLPELEYFATLEVGKTPEGGSVHAHLAAPFAMSLHPRAALPAASNVILNARLRPLDAEWVELEYLPWVTAEKRGPLFVVRVKRADIAAVMRIVRSPPEAELEELRRAEERAELERTAAVSAVAAPVPPWSPSSPPVPQKSPLLR